MNLNLEFSKALALLQTEADKAVAIKVIPQILRRLESVTPVDTGFAKASWKTEAALEGSKICNNTPYIEYLNAGSSKQAPAFFIERVALEFGKPKGQIVTIVPDRSQ
jgi:hypothetical protein